MVKHICLYPPGSDTPCGRDAVAVIKVKVEKVKQESAEGKDLGSGTISTFLPVCLQHRECYPDHEGFTVE